MNFQFLEPFILGTIDGLARRMYPCLELEYFDKEMYHLTLKKIIIGVFHIIFIVGYNFKIDKRK